MKIDEITIIIRKERDELQEEMDYLNQELSAAEGNLAYMTPPHGLRDLFEEEVRIREQKIAKLQKVLDASERILSIKRAITNVDIE